MKKSTQSLPSINDDLTVKPRQKIDLSKLKSSDTISDDRIEKNSKTIGEKWGANTQLNAEKTAKVPLANLRGEIPKYLDQELAVKAAQLGVTKTYLIMESLSKSGYHVAEEDLVEDRRRLRKKGNL